MPAKMKEPTSDYTRASDGDYRRDQETGESPLKDSQHGAHVGEVSGEVFVMDVYEFRQDYGYLSIFVSSVQTIILLVMAWQCGLAPLNVNPMVGPYMDALSYWGATNSVLIIEDGESWRLLSPVLLHAGILHLFGNVAVQIETGAFFEREWGSFVWLLVYVSSGIGGSLLSTIMFPSTISVGSSGAVMGLFGAKLTEVLCRACEGRSSGDTLQERVGAIVRKEQGVGTLFSVGLVMAFSFIPYVDWAAHLGGLLAGMSVGMLIFSFYVRSIVFKLLWFLMGMACTVSYFVKTTNYLYGSVEPEEMLRDVCEYYQEFDPDYECSCQKDNLNWGYKTGQ